MGAAFGTVRQGFEGVKAAFAAAQADDRGGAQLCIFRHGEKVADLWAGNDPPADRLYTDNTLTGYTCNNMLWDSMKPYPRWLPWTAALREAIGMEAA